MNAIYKLLDDGGFVAGDRDSGMTCYAYPSSPHAMLAKQYPKMTAEDMLAGEKIHYRKIQAIRDYDARNWDRLDFDGDWMGKKQEEEKR